MGRSKGSLYALMGSGGSAGVGGSIEIFGDLSSREVLNDEGDSHDCGFESSAFDIGGCSPSVTIDWPGNRQQRSEGKQPMILEYDASNYQEKKTKIDLQSKVRNVQPSSTG